MVLDVVAQVQQFLDVFLTVYVVLLLLVILTSWVPRLPYALNPVLRFLHDVCDPYLNIFRRFIPPVGPLDLSPMVAIVVLIFVREILDSLMGRLH